MARNNASKVPAKAANGSGEGKTVRCAIYTRKSTEEGLQQEFNSLDAQREASEAFVASQKHEGWQVITEHFDDGGYTGGNMDRPALKRLLAAVEARSVDCIVVYKVDRLSRSLLDFARIIEVFDRNGVSFVAVTQQFNTTSSLGRLTLNILLSFAQFEREIISERTRDKMSAARRKGKWIGGHPVLGYDIDSKGGRIVVNPGEAEQVRTLFGLYLAKGSTLPVLQETQRVGLVSKRWTTEDGKVRGGKPFTRGSLHATLTNVLYTGMVDHKGILYHGEHDRIIDQETWDRVHETLQRNGSDKGATARMLTFSHLISSYLWPVYCRIAGLIRSGAALSAADRRRYIAHRSGIMDLQYFVLTQRGAGSERRILQPLVPAQDLLKIEPPGSFDAQSGRGPVASVGPHGQRFRMTSANVKKLVDVLDSSVEIGPKKELCIGSEGSERGKAADSRIGAPTQHR
jgi:site-specific DNA recombinase